MLPNNINNLIFTVETHCVLCEVGNAFRWTSGFYLVQAFSRFPFPAETLVRFQAGQCDICGGQSATVAGVLPSTLAFPASIFHTKPYTRTYLISSFYQKDQRAKTGHLVTTRFSFRYREWIGQTDRQTDFYIVFQNCSFKNKCSFLLWLGIV